ncbi:uncharacterized protein EDB91DRAFT_1233923 [Suillus paluster]|uniref:uncharacterized protein n=1 Tax=Suillus paluster TaxID=48578 RepID=UPI001B867968|nr:uncharacterized protein EDB91DRAFT_1233923 [Suillus paluster]KAG1755166.1 hypothetical protein EDB91DRAFT_1233923 [Suillus paluster]
MSLSASTRKAPSIPSTSSRAASVRSHALVVPSTTRTVVTAPPWAQDEPPSPIDDGDHHPYDQRPSDVAASRSSFGGLNGTWSELQSPWGTFSRSSFGGLNGTWSELQSPWGTFTRPREAQGEPSGQAASKKGAACKKRPSLSLYTNRQSCDEPHSSTVSPLEKGVAQFHVESGAPPSLAPFALSHNKTPGWDTPWEPTHDFPTNFRGDYSHLGAPGDRSDGESGDRSSSGKSRKKRFRTFILTNIYVPLLFRFINITFTTTALALAIRIRMMELHYGVMGIVGSSPTLVIIFAPLTLVHVMLEYFGRPMGLWRTSGKLAHTLLEVCFICAWSAAFSLCFDNFFTSLIPCASASSIAWYNELSRPKLTLPDLGRNEGGVGDTICDYQLALICLVGVGLVTYCINLVISLFRIFEKVKSYAGFRPT